jgi:hypothetical protein
LFRHYSFCLVYKLYLSAIRTWLLIHLIGE